LRNAITVISQTPTIIEDTLRNNLDPFGKCTDGDLHEVLHKVLLQNFISRLPHGLESKINELGLSIGEKQLVNLARAILKNSRLVVLDEPTASLDVETEIVIKKILTECFEESTVLCISHRYNLVKDCDKILVMDKGQVVEFTRPAELLANEQGNVMVQ